MAGNVNLGSGSKRIYVGDELFPITSVEVYTKTELITAATGEVGRSVIVQNDWGTQNIANGMLETLRGFRYQPYSVENIELDPAVEVGDVAYVSNIRGAIWEMDVDFRDRLIVTITAPEEKEINHDYKFQQPAYRSASRSAGAAQKKADVTYDLAVETHAGVSQITDYNPLTGYAIAEEALYASILDKESGGFKQARISASVVRHADEHGGTMESLAEILADVIDLKGRVDVTGIIVVEGDGFSTDGNISSAKGRVFTKDLTVTSGVITMSANDIGSGGNATLGANGLGVVVNGTTYGKKEITFAYDPKTEKKIANFNALVK